jgi:hypothetical protein
MVASNTYRLFISHASEDRAVAMMLHDEAQRRGATPYVDTKYLHAGVDFKRELIGQIRASDEMLVLLSPKFERSRWLVFEAGIAEGAGVPMIPMLR